MTATADTRLRDLLNGFQATEALHAAAVLAIPDLLAQGPHDAGNLAQATGTQVAALDRLLRVLVELDVLARDGALYSLASLGQRLRSDAAGGWRAWALMLGQAPMRAAWTHLVPALRTGSTGFEAAHGTDIWSHRAHHEEDGALFDLAMQSGAERMAGPLADLLGDLGGKHIVDVGGGDGTLLARLLERNATATGTLLERPGPAARARRLLARRALLHRVQVVEGDFFEQVTAGADLYLLKSVLHDWDDAEACAILRACKLAIAMSGEHARIVVIERLLGQPGAAIETALSDLHMLVNTGGRERTADHYEALLRDCGLRLEAVTAVMGSLAMLQAMATGG